jgi:undecaprenyl-diphosphatase
MIGVFESIILGIIQGLTEWFPVSSSGHLVLFQNIFGVEVPLAYDIYLHLGTLFVLFVFFWRDIFNIVKDVLLLRKTENSRLGVLIIAGSVITAVVGFTFYDFFSSMFSNLLFVGIAFLITGVLLFLSGKVKIGRKNVGFVNSLFIGLAQGLALIPGISRSGSTISIGMISGVDRIKVAKFSFLLSIPAIVGASLIESISGYETIFPFLIENLLAVILGVVFSAVTGYICLSALMKIIKKGWFYYFSYYCFSIGLITLIIWAV